MSFSGILLLGQRSTELENVRSIHYIVKPLLAGPESWPWRCPNHQAVLSSLELSQLPKWPSSLHTAMHNCHRQAPHQLDISAQACMQGHFPLNYHTSVTFFRSVLFLWPYVFFRPYSHRPWSWPYLAMCNALLVPSTPYSARV